MFYTFSLSKYLFVATQSRAELYDYVIGRVMDSVASESVPWCEVFFVFVGYNEFGE